MPPRVRSILAHVGARHGLTLQEMLDARTRRPHRIAAARLAFAGFSTTQIANWMRRDRANVWRSIRTAVARGEVGA